MKETPWRGIVRWGFRGTLLFAVAALVLVVSLRKTVRVPTLTRAQAVALLPQLPSMLDKVLKVVDAEGLVDYKTLRRDPALLERALAVMARVSPANEPALFPTTEARLAYWINAYNAAVLRAVLVYPTWRTLFSRWRQIRFFVMTGFVFGGKRWNLYDLENRLMRPTFREPLLHFAINCASFGCPVLPKKAFRAKGLRVRLVQEARRFLNESRNVRVDKAQKTIYLSPILSWFRSDFLDWGLPAGAVDSARANKQDPILRYINRYRRDGEALPLAGYRVRILRYDWRVNTQQGPSRSTPLRRQR